MKVEINPLDYLSQQEIKDIAIDEIRNKIRGYLGNEENTKRVLSNLSYQIIFDEVDRNLGESAKALISKNTLRILNKQSNYSVFRDKDSLDRQDSEATKILRQTVKDNKQLIQEKVKATILDRDYEEEVWTKFEQLGDNFMSNIYDMVDLIRQKRNKNEF